MVSSSPEHAITRWLGRTSMVWFTLYTSVSVFCLYTCIFAFRKTFTAATFEGMAFAGVSYKVWLVIFQMVGYGLSKFVGIKVIAELRARSRSRGILAMVAIACVAWLFFGLVPSPYNMIFLFANGFPLGMVWGMVFGYIEGRRVTEVLGASLAVSFIFSAGLCRSAGGFIMRDWHVSEFWMPFVASLVFAVPLLLFLWLMDKVPPPSPLDEQMRTRRQPMNKAERNQFVATFLPGIILFVLTYVLLTAFRDFRDNFSAEVWKSLGYGNSPGIFTATEVPVSIAVLVVMGSLMLIRDNHRALMVNHLIIAAGMLLVGVSTFLFESGMIDPPLWMILIGLGLYLGYIPFNSIFFDRLIAAFRYAGTVGFIMYIADAFGYLGSISVMLLKEFGYKDISWMRVFTASGYILSGAGTLLILGSMVYFHRKQRPLHTRTTEPLHV